MKRTILRITFFVVALFAAFSALQLVSLKMNEAGPLLGPPRNMLYRRLIPWSIFAQIGVPNLFNGVNLTSVIAAGATASDQSLQAIAVPGLGAFNVLNRSMRVDDYSTIQTTGTGNGTLTYKLKICTAANFSAGACGTSVTLAAHGPTATTAASLTGNPIECHWILSTSTTGASGTFLASGWCLFQTTSTTVQTNAPIFATLTTANSSTIDLTQQLFLQVTVADSGASANNSITSRMLTYEWFSGI